MDGRAVQRAGHFKTIPMLLPTRLDIQIGLRIGLLKCKNAYKTFINILELVEQLFTEMDCANLNNPEILDKTIIPGDTQVVNCIFFILYSYF